MCLNDNRDTLKIMAVAFVCRGNSRNNFIDVIYRDKAEVLSFSLHGKIDFVGCGDMLILVSGDKCQLWPPNDLSRPSELFRLAGSDCNGIYESNGLVSYSLAPDNACYTFEIGNEDNSASRQWYHGNARLPTSSVDGTQISSTTARIYTLRDAGKFVKQIGIAFPDPQYVDGLGNDVRTIGRCDNGWINNQIFTSSTYGRVATHDRDVIFACTCSYIGEGVHDAYVLYFVDEDMKLYTIKPKGMNNEILPYDNSRSVLGWVVGLNDGEYSSIDYYPVLDDGYVPWLDMTIIGPEQVDYSVYPYWTKYVDKSRYRVKSAMSS